MPPRPAPPAVLAVIWTDFVQSIAMFAVAIISLIFAVTKSGGLGEVYSTLDSNHRLIPGYYFGWHPYTYGVGRKDKARHSPCYVVFPKTARVAGTGSAISSSL